MSPLVKRYLAASFIILALAVIFGAFGAHALKNHLSEHYLSVFETGNKYHFIHGLGMAMSIFILSNKATSKQISRLAILFLMGIILFSGSLYMLSLAETLGLPFLKMLGAVAPIGGLFFISSWIYSAYLIVK